MFFNNQMAIRAFYSQPSVVTWFLICCTSINAFPNISVVGLESGCLDISAENFDPIFHNPSTWDTYSSVSTLYPEDCAHFCSSVIIHEGNYTYYGIRKPLPTDDWVCYCFNDLFRYVDVAISASECLKSCNETNCAKRMQIFLSCPVGFWGPPFCEARCEANCPVVESYQMRAELTGSPNRSYGKAMCYANGTCINRCTGVGGYCFSGQVLQTINGVNTAYMDKPYLTMPLHMPVMTIMAKSGQMLTSGYVYSISAYISPFGWCYIGFWDIVHRTGSATFQVALRGKTLLKSTLPGYFSKDVFSEQLIPVSPETSFGVHFSQMFQDFFKSDPGATEDYTVVYGTNKPYLGAKEYLAKPDFDPDSGEQFNNGWQPGTVIDGVTYYDQAYGYPSRYYTAAVAIQIFTPCPEECQRGLCTDTLACMYGCNPGFIGLQCTERCPGTRYGLSCQQRCPLSCTGNVCHPVTGECNLGCKMDLSGTYCQDSNCPHGFYGRICNKQCSQFCKNKVCAQDTGECLFGCELGYQPPNCQTQCALGSYGFNCSMTCGKCKNRDPCNVVNGYCENGCIHGKALPLCMCEESFFGPQCLQVCGSCGNGAICMDNNGTCPNFLCKTGFQPPTCKCPFLRYGAACDQICGNCKDNLCMHDTGLCAHGCTSGYWGDKCLLQCSPMRYGQDCSYHCGHCKNGTCDTFTGVCNECVVGFKAPNCQECTDHRFGFMCSRTCGNCKDGAQCAPNGTCTNGCEQGYTPPFCTCAGTLCTSMCPAGRYGDHCENTCSLYCKNGVCNKATGVCSQGCEPGFLMPFCICLSGYYGLSCTVCGQCTDTCHPETGYCLQCKEGYKMPYCHCPKGYYGEACESQCGHCVNNDECQEFDGTCPNGCDRGYQPPLCTDLCKPGTYGDNCQQMCGSCLNKAICDPINGSCPGGCEGFFSEPLCKLICPDNRYGFNCEEKCGNCYNGKSCDVHGVCPLGCYKGYLPPLCQDQCPPGSYGYFCQETCGSCMDQTPCHYQTGKCSLGCAPGYYGSLCTLVQRTGPLHMEICPSGYYGTNCLQKCGFCENMVSCQPADGVCPGNCMAGFMPPLCVKICTDGLYGTNCQKSCGQCNGTTYCNIVTGNCPYGCKSDYYGFQCDKTVASYLATHNQSVLHGFSVVVIVTGNLISLVYLVVSLEQTLL